MGLKMNIAKTKVMVVDNTPINVNIDRKCPRLRVVGTTLQHQGKEPGQRGRPLSATSNFFSCAFFNAHVSAPYISAGLTTVLYTFPLIFMFILLSHNTPDTLFQFFHPLCTRWKKRKLGDHYDKKIRQGRPVMRWRDDMDKYWSDTIWQRTAQDRIIWRRHAEAFAYTTGHNGCPMMMMMIPEFVSHVSHFWKMLLIMARNGLSD